MAVLGKLNEPTDAPRRVFSSGMDALVIGSFLVEEWVP
jgi:predicted NodU family carbamoyl transferase